jgi:hypothetical protein
MGERLKRNICSLDDHAILSEVRDIPIRKETHIGDALEYACRFWTKHLLETPSKTPHIEEVQNAIDKFFTVHLLYWIEVLAITGNLGTGVYSMNDIEKWYSLVSVPAVCLSNLFLMVFQAGITSKWTNDSQRFLLEHFDTIHNSPSNIYHSALLLSPSPWLHKCYTQNFHPW